MHRRSAALVSLLAPMLLACSEAGPSGPSPVPTGEFSVAMSAYAPAAPGNCSADIHNQFSTDWSRRQAVSDLAPAGGSGHRLQLRARARS
jgi:hypothetical protein